jgi:hypothetical protein
VPLREGEVLVMGAPPSGFGLPVNPTSQVFNPGQNTITDVGLPRDLRESGYTVTVLDDGRVLVAGGRLGVPPYRSAELFLP